MTEPIEIARRESSALRISVRTAAILLAFTLVFTALMAGTYRATAPLVAASALAEKLRLIGEVLPPSLYDNDLMADAITLAPQKALGLDDQTRAWRARKNGKPVALVLEAAALDGYSGRISLILAIDAEGRLLAQRVTAHKETPGLGDYIDPKKDRNKARPWITQFSNLGFDSVPREKWRVKKDGGRFDQMSGATISARAVTNASGRALTWAVEHHDNLFALPANGRYEEPRSKP
ncbi:MAG: electron transporter RnfG [Rhodocyclales bacterium RIFCSPLOWO2_02_FULL_63_24]|nr:MAG: electron transporter RnfG [Rhodocyclales bacterium GWA2_65_19]OHC68016.1 MAG: electron transporter RnfG [Rhodocyclales bacterium RIFCSPLOWO2_02_FULL_63_24]